MTFKRSCSFGSPQGKDDKTVRVDLAGNHAMSESFLQGMSHALFLGICEHTPEFRGVILWPIFSQSHTFMPTFLGLRELRAT